MQRLFRFQDIPKPAIQSGGYAGYAGYKSYGCDKVILLIITHNIRLR
ncbi:MAG: hypothetical protein LBE39_10860 [Flavobacteriaceae bacterium]|nr:hypothetical protein [Flavobacteriaceae bacterium]